MTNLEVSRISVQIFESTEQSHGLFRPPDPEIPAFEVEGPFSHWSVKPARDNGWELRVKCARGPWRHATQEKFKIVHYISALYIRGDLRVAAIWTADVGKEGARYSFEAAIRNDQMGLLGAKDLTTLLKSAPKGAP